MEYTITVEITVTGCTNEDEAVQGTAAALENLISGDIVDTDIIDVKEVDTSAE